MKKVVIFFLFVLPVAMVSAQNISNVNFHQVGDEIVITYDLDESSPIGAYVSLDGGKSYKEMRSVRGDVGKTVLPGKKRIVWKVLNDIPEGLSGQVQFKVFTNLFVSEEDFMETALGINMKMVYVAGGSFTMGATSEQGDDALDNENPAHQVSLSGYYIGAFEVTQGQWKKVMGTNPSNFRKGTDYPVEYVSWEDAQSFCQELSRKTGRTYTLPTEAQWEYAARGGSKSEGTKYSGSRSIDAVAWYDGNSGSSTHPVGTKRPNALGLYDMSGNVREWCQDWYQDWYSAYRTYDTQNPTGASSGFYRVLRGGGWDDLAKYCRVSNRDSGTPSDRGYNCGFRVVCLP